MKISIVSGFFLPIPALRGGAMEKIWHRFAKDFAASGHDITVISRRWDGLSHDEVVNGVRHLRLRGYGHRRQLVLNLVLDLLWSVRVLRRLPTADAVISNTVCLPLFLPKLRSDAGLVYASLGRMPKGQIRLYNGVSCLLAPSKTVVDRIEYENPKLTNRVLMFPNPIDWQLHYEAGIGSRQNRPQGSRTLVIGYAGRIHPEKGLEQLLDACVHLASRPDLPRWSVRLIGPYLLQQGGGGVAYRDSLLANYSKVLGASLTFQEPIYDPLRLAQAYGDMDVFCYPSLASKGEGLSVAPLEAMAAGAVPVLSDLEIYREIVAHGKTGFRFNHTASRSQVTQELAETLTQLLLNSAMRWNVGRAAAESVKMFDYGVLGQKLLVHMTQATSIGRARNGS